MGMSIYIEYVIIDNLVIDLIILVLLTKILRLKTTRLRLFVSSVIGTAFACIMPIIVLNPFLLFIIKLLIGGLMVFIVSKFNMIKGYIYAYISFLGLTFALGGFCFGLLFLLGSSAALGLTLNYSLNFPIGIIIAAIALYIIIIKRLASYLSAKKHISSFIYEVCVEVCGHKINFTALLDSGNRLRDTKTNFPVIIVSENIFKNNFSKGFLIDFFNEKNKEIIYSRTVQFSTISGERNEMFVFLPDNIYVNGKRCEKNILVGITKRKFSDAIKYEGLLHAEVF